MKIKSLASVTVLMLCTLNALAVEPKTAGNPAPLNSELIMSQTGLKGSMSGDGVFKVSFPRKDLKAKVGQVRLTPPLGLTAWAAFKRTGDQVMVMGDLVMTENQVNPVMDVALENGLEVTALHNHFFLDQPKIMFMHIGGLATEENLAGAVGKVFAKLKETIKTPPKFPSAAIDPAKSKLNTKDISSIIGHSGDLNKGVYKITVGRTTKMHGHEMGKSMGVNTWAAFAGTDKQAMVDGDFAMLEDEVQGVIKALRKSGIQIVAIHNHMTHERPRIVFLHYWGIGPVASLAKGVRSALDTQKK